MSNPVDLDLIVDQLVCVKCLVGCMNRYQAEEVLKRAKWLFDECKDRLAILDREVEVSQQAKG